MFGMGMNEFLLVMAIGLIVIGPKQLPQVAKGLGKMMAQFKRATNELRNAVTDEVGQHVDLDDLRDLRRSMETEAFDLRKQSRALLEGEFEEERKIGAGVVDEMKRAAEDMPSSLEEFEVKPPAAPEPAPPQAEPPRPIPPDSVAVGSVAEEPPAATDDEDKPPDGRYV